MLKKFVIFTLFALIAFAIPIEHKYDKLFRFFSLTLIPQGLEISPHYDPKLYFYLSDIAALFILIFSMKNKNFFKNPLWLLFFCAIISIALSPFKAYPICYTRLLQLISPIILYSFLANGLSADDRSKLTKIIFTSIIVASFFQAAVAFLQFYYQSPLGLRIFGETTNPNYFSITKDGKTLNIMRSCGTFTHPNTFGGFMALSIFASSALFFLQKNGKWIFIATIPIQILAMCLSFSRSALFGWAIGTAIWVLFLLYSQKNNPIIRKFILVTSVSFGLIFLSLFNLYSQRGGVVNYTETTKMSDSVRLKHQKASFKIIKDHPLFGVGFSQFTERSQKYLVNEKDPEVFLTAPHNIFLFLASETGLVSLFIFAFWILSLLYKTIKSQITIEQIASLSIFATFLFIGLCDFYLILFQEGRLMFFIVAGLLASQLSPTFKHKEEFA